MTKLFAASLLLLSVGSLFATGVIQDPQQLQKDESAFMKRKLTDAKQIVAGLATEDFDLISKSAQDLMLLSHEADWNVVQTAPYIGMSREFRSSAQRLRDYGNDKNLDGATLAYFEVTLNCVRCHKYIRRNHFPLEE